MTYILKCAKPALFLLLIAGILGDIFHGTDNVQLMNIVIVMFILVFTKMKETI